MADVLITETAVAVSVLRVRQPDAAAPALARAFAQAWPTDPNTVVRGRPDVAWLAPGEWALFDHAEALSDRVEAALAGQTHHLADVSAGRRLWRIEGAEARALLAKGCSLDTDPRVLAEGQCAQSLLAQVHVLIIPSANAARFDILADASLAGHLRAWFADAALEFQP